MDRLQQIEYDMDSLNFNTMHNYQYKSKLRINKRNTLINLGPFFSLLGVAESNDVEYLKKRLGKFEKILNETNSHLVKTFLNIKHIFLKNRLGYK